jgi:hypothetical protein
MEGYNANFSGLRIKFDVVEAKTMEHARLLRRSETDGRREGRGKEGGADTTASKQTNLKMFHMDGIFTTSSEVKIISGHSYGL